MEKISVVIPVHNASQYIIKCLKSIENQHPDIEIVLIDDGSIDNLENVLFPVASTMNFKKFNYIKMKNNVGPAEARNIGIKESTGDFIAFLDADDWWEPGKLEEELKLIKEKDVPFVYTGRTNIYQSTGKIKHIPCSEELKLDDILKNNQITCSSVLIKNEVAKKYLMERSDLCEDFYTWIRILRDYDHVCGINKPYVNYRVHKDSLSGNKIKNAVKRYKTLKLASVSRIKRIYYFTIYMLTGLAKNYVGKIKEL